jgi:hypothetical protein
MHVTQVMSAAVADPSAYAIFCRAPVELSGLAPDEAATPGDPFESLIRKTHAARPSSGPPARAQSQPTRPI